MSGAAPEVRAPQTDSEWQRYYELRWRILRAPWEPHGPARDESDDTSTHRMLCDADGRVLAVGRLHRVDASTAQLRFMAVESGYQGNGYGSRLLHALEQTARHMQFGTLILQARENAVPFYRRHGYRVVKKTFLLFDEIQHYLMEKPLDT